MKLSEAMRAGAKIRPQGFGQFNTVRRLRWYERLLGRKAEIGSCAWGAAVEAAGGGTREHVITEGESMTPFRPNHALTLQQSAVGQVVQVADYPFEWRLITDSASDCPQCGRKQLVFQLITHLNDDHRWAREEIAGFVERLEQALESAPAFTQPVPQNEEWPEVVSGI